MSSSRQIAAKNLVKLPGIELTQGSYGCRILKLLIFKKHHELRLQTSLSRDYLGLCPATPFSWSFDSRVGAAIGRN